MRLILYIIILMFSDPFHALGVIVFLTIFHAHKVGKGLSKSVPNPLSCT